MSEKLSRFMQGINAATAEREPHERQAFLAGMLAACTWREMRDKLRAYKRGEDDWRTARVFIELKLSALLADKHPAEREDA